MRIMTTRTLMVPYKCYIMTSGGILGKYKQETEFCVDTDVIDYRSEWFSVFT